MGFNSQPGGGRLVQARDEGCWYYRRGGEGLNKIIDFTDIGTQGQSRNINVPSIYG